ncbi:YceI family protein [Actinomadura madurae]|uniref:YceI family protein n=1 Tax=Actinomadura madurae TaxID=1993 RepID=UPI0020264D39|nr:YceI family protein [Actinomadura madurae]MCP9953322.1 YceI family protein [Actinomadura madurae]MCP9982543.1 YceI family protein [Actinomadura madurae]MCQ0005920.1 YceI family protein [Actinomadura madurae]MCQ0018789.1 YceI family protein [Actinomadura madurae]URM98789.1 YceI family protein [Actinomadura madurae]
MEGTFELGPDSGRLLVRTGRSGLGRRAGHDLTIEATRWSAAVEAREPLDATSPEVSIEVTVEVDGLEVREGTGGVKPLSDQDRAEIKKNLRKVLDVRRHPRIRFVSTGAGEDAVEGDLTIMGRTKPVRVRAVRAGDRVRGGATVTQSRWGITPYSAFFGALRLADDVEIEFDLRLPA